MNNINQTQYLELKTAIFNLYFSPFPTPENQDFPPQIQEIRRC